MATKVWESNVQNMAISDAWEVMRPLDFAALLPSVVQSSVLVNDDAADRIGSQRVVTYKDGATWTIQLIELSDLDHRLTWITVAAEPATQFSSRTDTIELKRISEDDSVFVEWTTDFSSDAGQAVIMDCRLKKLDALKEFEASLPAKFWTAKRVRDTFVQFFQQHEHVNWPSSSVVPHEDPTLLFANAGMNQFKPIFLGQLPPNSPMEGMKRACNTQKCIRAGGKHNDLEDVGFDVYHHTFFEMLGNWSFGDYFKKDAITWAWNLLTKVYRLDPDRLYATYFEGDKKENLEPDLEARDLWLQFLPADHVLTGNKKDNFWEMGATGPCGPCTEIHYDRIGGGRNAAHLVNGGAVNGRDREPGFVEHDDPNVLEIWNNVFMQFNRLPDGSLKKLPAQSVDTGMGFERLTSVLQNKYSNYDTDIFSPIFAKISELASGTSPGGRDCKVYGGRVGEGTPGMGDGKADEGQVDMAYRVLSDHIRTITFAIADGAYPGAKDRGYVLRRVLRRAVRFGQQCLNCKPGFFTQMVPTVVEHFKAAFPELEAKEKFVMQVIKDEEDQFGRTLKTGLKIFNKYADALSEGDAFPGAMVHKLKATYGFPPELTELMCDERKLKINQAEFEAADEAARELSRAAGKDDGAGALGKLEDEQGKELVKRGVKPTDYSMKWEEHIAPTATVMALFVGATADSDGLVASVDDPAKVIGVVLDKTPFYAEAGGQASDTGKLLASESKAEEDAVELFDVVAVEACGMYFLHKGTVATKLSVGDVVTCSVDYARRAKIAPNHTMTHVLNFALRQVLGPDVDQAGSSNDPQRARFDFNCQKQMTVEQICEVEGIVNQKIEDALQVFTKEVEYKEAMKIKSIRAVFSESYPKFVRVVTIGGGVDAMLADPTSAQWSDYSVELCGGTHVPNTSVAKKFALMNEEAISKGVRRIMAVTGAEAIEAHVQLKALESAFDLIRYHIGKPSMEAELVVLKKQMLAHPIPIGPKRRLLKTFKELEKGMLKVRREAEKKSAGNASEAIEADVAAAAALGQTALVLRVDQLGSKSKQISKVLQKLTKKNKDISVMFAVAHSKGFICQAMVSKTHSGAGMDAAAWVKSVMDLVGGRGGGKANSAQGSSKDASKGAEFEAGLEAAKKYASQFN